MRTSLNESVNKLRGLSLTEIQVQVEQSSSTTVETTSEQTIEITQTVEREHKQVVTEESSSHLTKEEIEEYEESQAKFRELWEKKREKVRVVWFELYYDSVETFVKEIWVLHKAAFNSLLTTILEENFGRLMLNIVPRLSLKRRQYSMNSTFS